MEEIISNLLKKLQAIQAIMGFQNLQVSQFTKDTKPTPPATVRPLLHQYNHLFLESQSLPPEWTNNHQIHIRQGAGVANMPYRYPYFQKQENKKLVNEMLFTGVIIHSTTPSSSTLLLVKKKDGS